MRYDNIKSDVKQSKLQDILSKISVEALTHSIGMKIDLARISFMLDSVVVLDFEEFRRLLLFYYLHILINLNRITVPVNFDLLDSEVSALLERTFLNRGGTKAAFNESLNGFQGGMRLILDQLTDQFKNEEMEKRINHVLRYSLDPLDWGIKVSLIKDLLEALKPILPPEIYNEQPAKYANQYETLVRSYINSMDQLKYKFQSF